MTTKSILAVSAFDAGKVAGLAAGNWLADSVAAVGELLPTIMTAADYKIVRAEWCKGYAEAMGCKPVTAENQWAKVWRGVEQAFGFAKPKTEEAKRKAAQRAAKKAAAESTAPKTPTNGAEAAQKVKMELSRIEAHVVSLLRAGKYKAAVDCIHRLAEESDATA